MANPSPDPVRLMLCAVLAVGCVGPPLLAQSESYTLGESREWVETAPSEASGDAAVIAEARRHLAEDDPGAAEALLTPWIEANRRPGSAYLPEALLLRGDAHVALDHEFTALYDYEEVCKDHPQSDAFADAVHRELEIAIRYAHGLRIRIFGLRWGDPEDVLTELFLRVTERLPKSQAAERAMIELADYYYRRRELAQARDVYDAYLESFPAGPNALRAAERRIQCDVGRFKGPRYNAAPLIDAKVQIRQFQRRHPAEADATGLNAALASRLDESQAAQLLDTAEWYLRVGDRPSARLVLARLVRDHPRSLAAERAGAMLEREGWAVQASAPADPSAEPDPAASSAPPEPSP